MNNNARDLFFTIGISFWQVFVIFLSVLVISIFLILLWKKTKSFSKVILASFVGSLFIIALIILFNNIYPDVGYEIILTEGADPIYWTWKDELSVLLNVISNIYLNLIFIVLPFFIFFVTVTLILNNKSKNSNFFSKSFLSLIIPVLIGMFISLIMIPLIRNIDLLSKIVTENNDTVSELIDNGYYSIPMLISNTFINAGENVVNFIPILVLLVISILAGFSIKIYINKKTEKSLKEETEYDETKIIDHLETPKNIIFNYLKLVSYFIPFVILTKFPIIFLYPEKIIDLFKFIGVFLLGFIITVLIFNFINIFLLNKDNRKKYFKIYPTYIGNAFIKSNSMNYLPETIDVSKKLGVNSEISEFTSILALNIGPAICSGYYLMFLSLVGLSQVDALTFANVLIIFILVLAINLTTSGTTGGDQIARNIMISTLSVSFGVPVDFYYGTVFSLESFLEPIRHIGNSTSYLTANLIHQKLN